LELGRAGSRVLYISTEQSKEELAQRARLIASHWRPSDTTRALGSIEPEDGILEVEGLPNLLSEEVLHSSGKYRGTVLIILDSVQGHGLSATATRKYRQVYEFARQC